MIWMLALLGCVCAVLAVGYVHLARKVRLLEDDMWRHDDVLVEHTKQLDAHDELFGERPV